MLDQSTDCLVRITLLGVDHFHCATWAPSLRGTRFEVNSSKISSSQQYTVADAPGHSRVDDPSPGIMMCRTLVHDYLVVLAAGEMENCLTTLRVKERSSTLMTPLEVLNRPFFK